MHRAILPQFSGGGKACEKTLPPGDGGEESAVPHPMSVRPFAARSSPSTHDWLSVWVAASRAVADGVPRRARRWRDAPWPMAFGGKRTRVGGEDGGGLGRQWVGRRRVGSGGLGGGGLGNGGLGNGGPGNGGLENGGLGGGGLGGGGLGGGVLGVGGFGRWWLWTAAGWDGGGLGGDGFGQPTRRAGKLCRRGRGEKMSPFPVYPPLRHPFFSVDARLTILWGGRFPRRG